MTKININIAFLNDLPIVTNIKWDQTLHPKQSTTINYTTPAKFSLGITMMTNTLSSHHLVDLKITCILYLMFIYMLHQQNQKDNILSEFSDKTNVFHKNKLIRYQTNYKIKIITICCFILYYLPIFNTSLFNHSLHT